MKQRANALADKLASFKSGLGKITLACGIGMVLIGFPAQIYSNYKAHVCGIDPVLVSVVLLLYLVRIPYQVSAKAWYLLPADILGLTGSAILMYQYATY